MPSKYLSYTDRTGEIAFAVIMVVIINGYVALSELDSGFTYIVVVNLGACAVWGIIDGLIYAISSSIERNAVRNKLLKLKSLAGSEGILEAVKSTVDDTFLAGFDAEGKDAIAKDIVKHAPHASLGEGKALTQDEVMGWLSIIGIYVTVGFLLATPFLILRDKTLAWFISNAFGVGWLFWYGVQLGKVSGKNRLLYGALMALVSIGFLALSYFAYARGAL